MTRLAGAGAARLGPWQDAAPVPFWLDSAQRPAARAPLTASTEADLVVVGGGFSGLWTALQALERDPGRDVLLLDGDRIGWAASGRNGGFCAASLTHGEANGRAHFPQDYDAIDELGRRNLAELQDSLTRHGIDCGWERSGELDVATEPYQVAELADGGAGDFLDRDALRAEVNSPTYLAGRWNRDGVAMLDPARLAWGLAAAIERLGGRVHEGTPVTDLRRDGAGVRMIVGPAGEHVTVRARHVALGTNAFRPLLRRLRLATVPVWDYVLVTEPLTPAQRADIGWANRQGIGDSANQFHYYRLTSDDRILFGGYDAVHHYGRGLSPSYEQRPATFALLAEHLAATFPQLDGLGISHRWGGAIDTCTRFCPFFGTALGGRVSYALGFTGLGVGASRFGAAVMLDLLAGDATPRTENSLVRTRPLPFPPEPFAWLGIELTRRGLARADRNEGRRGPWLRTLDRFGVGFDS